MLKLCNILISSKYENRNGEKEANAMFLPPTPHKTNKHKKTKHAKPKQHYSSILKIHSILMNVKHFSIGERKGLERYSKDL